MSMGGGDVAPGPVGEVQSSGGFIVSWRSLLPGRDGALTFPHLRGQIRGTKFVSCPEEILGPATRKFIETLVYHHLGWENCEFLKSVFHRCATPDQVSIAAEKFQDILTEAVKELPSMLQHFLAGNIVECPPSLARDSCDVDDENKVTRMAHLLLYWVKMSSAGRVSVSVEIKEYPNVPEVEMGQILRHFVESANAPFNNYPAYLLNTMKKIVSEFCEGLIHGMRGTDRPVAVFFATGKSIGGQK